MKSTLIKAIALILISVIAGCTTVRTEYVQPNCYVPVLPTLPTISGGELFDLVGADNYYTLSLREKRLTDWALEMEAILEEVCE